MSTTHNELIICFVRKQYVSGDETKFVYIKRSSETGEYAVKFKTANNKSVVYIATQFLIPAISSLTLLMAEFGLSSDWRELKE